MNSQDTSIRQEAVTLAIEEALKTWAQELAKLISVRTSDHKVTLSGSVCSKAEAEALVAAVRNLPGMPEVEEKLSVVPYLLQRPGTEWR